MSDIWEPGNWKWPVKILIGIATVWPPIYMVLFFVIIFSFVLIMPFEEGRAAPHAQRISVIQIDRKIRNGEISELVVTRDEITAIDHSGVRFCASDVNESERQEILQAASERNESGQPRVPKIEEDTAAPPRGLPFAIAGFFGAHMLTILLMFALMPFYIILAVKNDRLDQTARIIWVVLLCTLTMFVAPIYWYLYIWRKLSSATTTMNSQAV